MKLVIYLAWIMTLNQTHPIWSDLTKIKSGVQKSMELWTTQIAEGHFGQLVVWKILSIIIQVCIIYCFKLCIRFLYKVFELGFCIRFL
jgi:hypothetical protein